MSSWFNKTLGEKLLEHLQKWADPGRIIGHKAWKTGDEPLVAAAIVKVFSVLPRASHFVEPLVKTCIKLEATLPAYKYRQVESPYRQPLAIFLNNYPEDTVNFFFQRLKTPMYSEMFQGVVSMPESASIRSHLMGHKSSLNILNICFERPLSIIRSEKTSPTNPKLSLALHGILQSPTPNNPNTQASRHMNTESLELQYQGFRLIDALIACDPRYFSSHNDILRAFRWLWRSKGRYLRLQHEDVVSPRYLKESTVLVEFLMAHAKGFPNDDLDILFELKNPALYDIFDVERFLCSTVSTVLSSHQKRLIFDRFFDLFGKDTSEETRLFCLQKLVLPLVEKEASLPVKHQQITPEIIKRFSREVINRNGTVFTCGVRLMVELLRGIQVFSTHYRDAVSGSVECLLGFCQNQFKHDDAACSGWAHLVASTIARDYHVQSTSVREIYESLLQSIHQDGQDWIRKSIDALAPVLDVKLGDESKLQTIQTTCQLVVEENSSTHVLSRVCRAVSRNPDLFFACRSKLAPHVASAVTRLGTPINASKENRFLALDAAQLLLDWHSRTGDLITSNMADAITNALVRVQIVSNEPADRRQSKGDNSHSKAVEERVVSILHSYLSGWSVTLRHSPFERIAERSKADHACLACIRLIAVFAETKYYDFISRYRRCIKKLIAKSILLVKENLELDLYIRHVVMASVDFECLGAMLLNALENAVNDATEIHKKKNPSRTSDNGARAQDRLSSEVLGLAALAMEMIELLCRRKKNYLLLVSTSLLTFCTALVKQHLSDTASKQRQGLSNAFLQSPGCFSHTPTQGILSSFIQTPVQRQRDRIAQLRGTARDQSSVTPVPGIVTILSIFEDSALPYLFTTSRKILFQIISSLLDGSDSSKILVICIRTAGKWLLHKGCGMPMTAKEEESLMWRLTAVNCSCNLNDMEFQPVADTLQHFISLYRSQQPNDRTPRIRKLMMSTLLQPDSVQREETWKALYNEDEASESSFWRLLHADLEGLGGRYWVVVWTDLLLRSVVIDTVSLPCVRALIQADPTLCTEVFCSLLQAVWSSCSSSSQQMQAASKIEYVLSQRHHTQLLGLDEHDKRCANTVRGLLTAVQSLVPAPVLDTEVLLATAESYNCWYEVITLLENQFVGIQELAHQERTLQALRHCHFKLEESDAWLTLSARMCKGKHTQTALCKERYGFLSDSIQAYTDILDAYDNEDDGAATQFEQQLCLDRWISLQRDFCQYNAVAEVASANKNSLLMLECAWKSRQWRNVRALCGSIGLLSFVEEGNPITKLCETLLAVADGKLSDVENLHAQTAQLCLYKWQRLPQLSQGSKSHESLLHFFHRLVEVRESGQIMVESRTHAKSKTLPDLKNLMNAWRHRLPNDWERLSIWDDVFAWRAHMFNAVCSSFHYRDPNTLATLHDRPWTVIRMAKAARKQGLRSLAFMLLSKTAEERAMSVSDAFLKLREQILTYYNPESELERHGGLNLINTTNLSYFDNGQKSEIFRLKALFLASLNGRSKSSQAYCHAVQIHPSHARAWNSWGDLCSSLGASAERQADQIVPSSPSDTKAKEARASASKKVTQYLAQAMGCYLESVQLEGHEWARLHVPKCLWMLAKDGPSHGPLCQTLEDRGSSVPAWVWLPWIPQLLTSFYRPSSSAVKEVFSSLIESYPQAVYYPLRSFYLERRDVERARSGATKGTGQQMTSVAIAEKMMSLLRRSHATLWSSLESILEELIVKFRPSYEEELLSTLVALVERAESQVGSVSETSGEAKITTHVWKTLSKMSVKFFRTTDSHASKTDERSKRILLFKKRYKTQFESDFEVSSNSLEMSTTEKGPTFSLKELLDRLRKWKETLEREVLTSPSSMALVETSPSLALFGAGDAPDLWPGSCDPWQVDQCFAKMKGAIADDNNMLSQSSTSSSAAAAKKAWFVASKAAASAANAEGIGGNIGGGSSKIEVPGQYAPNTSEWADVRPAPELHTKLVKFVPRIDILRRNDQLVRRIGVVGSDGRTYQFLLQFAVPYMTRNDERTAQVLYLLDKVIRKHTVTACAHLSLDSQPVIPVAQRLRLCLEPHGRSSLEDEYKRHCDSMQVDPTTLSSRFRSEMKVIASQVRDLDKEERSAKEVSERCKLFKRISECEGAESNFLLLQIQRRLGSFEDVYLFRRVFARQWGMNCLLQYAFSAMERTPSRVCFTEESGRVLSPDFRVAYSNHGHVENQVVPFRITPNIVNLIGFSVFDEAFISTIGRLALAHKGSRPEIDPIFRLLMRDDLISFYSKSNAKPDAETQDMEKQLLDRVSQNVASLHRKFGDCCPQESAPAVDGKISELINSSRDPSVLSQMPASFQGWL